MKQKLLPYLFIALGSLVVMLPKTARSQEPTKSSDDHIGAIQIIAVPSLTGVRASSSLAQETGISTSRKFGWGLGVLFEAPITAGTTGLGFAIGAIYNQRKFEVGTSSITLEREIPTLFIPAELRITLGNFLIVGAGAFGAVRVGDVKDTLKIGSGTLTSTTSTDHESFEWGLTASANLLFPVAEKTGLLVGARYLLGLSDGSNSAVYDEKIDDLQLAVGVSLGI